MISRTGKDFWEAFDLLPERVQEQARRTFAIWLRDLNYPSLQYKALQALTATYSVRIGDHYRALAIVRENTAYWF